MKKIALIGRGIGHSKSPHLFAAAGYSSEHYRYDLVESKTAEKGIRYLIENRYHGANVTAPFKEEVLAWCSHLSPEVEATGAANLLLAKGESFAAYNTDGDGAIAAIKERKLAPQPVLVVGAGGAAKGALYSLLKEGFTPTLINRTFERAKEVATHFGVTALEAQHLPQIAKEFKIVIYTATAPLKELTETSLSDALVIEPNYKSPSISPSQCREYFSGYHWLYWQAVRGFQLFTNRSPNLEAMWRAIGNS